MKVSFGLLVLLATSLSGCAHAPEHGTVAMKINDQEAHVAFSPAEVKPGDKLMFLKDTCVGKPGVNDPCHNTKVAEGIVTANLNDKYAAVRILPGGTYDEGTRVEKES
jgi:hypothetical protein